MANLDRMLWLALNLLPNGACSPALGTMVLTWDFQVQVTDAPDGSHRWGPAGPGDALLDSSLPANLHSKRAP